MSSRQIAQGLFMAAGIAILVLLIVPAVHLPFVVVHGPMTALRAQRAAWLFILLLRAAAFLFVSTLLTNPHPSKEGFCRPPLRSAIAVHCLSCVWRC